MVKVALDKYDREIINSTDFEKLKEEVEKIDYDSLKETYKYNAYAKRGSEKAIKETLNAGLPIYYSVDGVLYEEFLDGSRKMIAKDKWLILLNLICHFLSHH